MKKRRRVMTDIDKTVVIDAMEGLAMDLGGEFRDDYSGRGMYGETCVGVVFDYRSDIYEFMFDVYEETGYRLTAPAEDSMGISTIFYWPGLQRGEG
jgi:hypothetical protein